MNSKIGPRLSMKHSCLSCSCTCRVRHLGPTEPRRTSTPPARHWCTRLLQTELLISLGIYIYKRSRQCSRTYAAAEVDHSARCVFTVNVLPIYFTVHCTLRAQRFVDFSNVTALTQTKFFKDRPAVFLEFPPLNSCQHYFTYPRHSSATGKPHSFHCLFFAMVNGGGATLSTLLSRKERGWKIIIHAETCCAGRPLRQFLSPETAITTWGQA